MASEKRFMIVGDVPVWMHEAYSILNAEFHSVVDIQGLKFSSDIGTIIERYTTENVFQNHATICDMIEKRYFSFVLDGDTLIQIKTIADFTDNKAPSAYVAIPVKVEPFISPPRFYSIQYPHITIVPPNTTINKYCSDIGQLHEYKLSEMMPTLNTFSHHVMINYANHVTRSVRNGKRPVIACNEIVPGKMYTDESGYSILM
jgi:hypothetical protein